MDDSADAVPVVRIPERVDRRARLGPFPSMRDAAKFLCYAAAGALAAPWVSPFLWLPFVGVGLAVSVWQPEGRPIDARVLAYARWRVRSMSPRGRMTGRRDPLTRRGVVPLAPSCYLAVVRASGCPVAYLPPVELARKFERYRELLRTVTGSFALLSTTYPIRSAPVLPVDREAPGTDREARQGYGELVELLCRRRRTRRVYVAVRNAEAGPDALARLEAQASSLAEQLRGLGLRVTRLRDRELDEAVRQFGWVSPEARP